MISSQKLWAGRGSHSFGRRGCLAAPARNWLCWEVVGRGTQQGQHVHRSFSLDSHYLHPRADEAFTLCRVGR